MLVRIILLTFALCFTLFCITHGAPAGGSGTNEEVHCRAHYPYTKEENDFIRERAMALCQKKDMIPWKQIAGEIEEKVENKELGFNKKRTPSGLLKHFKHLQPDVPGVKTRKTSHAHGYSKQEEEFINKELANDCYRSELLYAAKIWECLAEKHNLKRKQNCEGFSTERSSSALQSHFKVSMKTGRRVSNEVMARFPRNFPNYEEGTSSNRKKEIDLNAMPSDEEDDGEE